MIIADFKCPKCKTVIEDLEVATNHYCKCGSKMDRIYGYRKFNEFEAGMYDNFEHDPIYIGSRKQFKKECRDRGYVQTMGRGCYDASMGRAM